MYWKYFKIYHSIPGILYTSKIKDNWTMNHKASNVFQIDFSIPKNKREDKNTIYTIPKKKKHWTPDKNNIFFFNAHNFLVSRIFFYILCYICFRLKLKFNFILLEHWTTNQFSICLLSNVRHILSVLFFAMNFRNVECLSVQV